MAACRAHTHAHPFYGHLDFVDLEKAFNTVPREVIRYAMCKLGVEE